MKKIYLILTTITFFTLVGVVNAQTTAETVTNTPTPTTSDVSVTPTKTNTRSTAKDAMITQKAQNDAQRLTDLKQRAQTEIDRRIKALNNLVTRLGNMKKISDVELADFTSQIQTEIDGLTILKSEIEQETDLTTLREKVKSIVTDYYIFAFFIQYINISAALDRALATQTNMATVVDKLSTRINEAESAGKDVTELKSLLSGIQTKLTDLNTLIVATQDGIADLDSDGYPGNKTTLQDARTKLKTIHTSFKEIHTLAKQLIQLLRPAVEGRLTPAVTTLTLTPTPTVAQ